MAAEPFAIAMASIKNLFSRMLTIQNIAVAFVFALAVQVVTSAEQTCTIGNPPPDFRSPLVGVKLEGAVVLRTVFIGVNEALCASICQQTLHCGMYNLGPYDVTGLVRSCEFLDDRAESSALRTSSVSTWRMGGRKCVSYNPCRNGEECVAIGPLTKSIVRCMPVCPSGWKFYSSKCYKLYTDKKKWDKAKEECAKAKGSLAVIKDEETNRFLWETFVQTSGEDAWLGLREKRQEEGTYVWEDYATLTGSSYKKWFTGQPDGRSDDCVTMVTGVGSSGHWSNERCGGKKNYLCEKYATRYT